MPRKFGYALFFLTLCLVQSATRADGQSTCRLYQIAVPEAGALDGPVLPTSKEELTRAIGNKVILIIGAPGAGKGTQAEAIKQRVDISHVSTGELLRKEIASGSDLGKQVESYVKAGKLAPRELVRQVMQRHVASLDPAKPILLDGFPRSITQMQDLESILSAVGRQVDVVINLEITDEKAIERLGGRRVCPSCGVSYHVKFKQPHEEGVCDHCKIDLTRRADDNPTTIKERLDLHHNESQPILDAFAAKDVGFSVDGTAPGDRLTDRILQVLVNPSWFRKRPTTN